MNRSPSVLLLTGDQLRHRYAAQRLAQSVDVCAIVSEEKPKPAQAASTDVSAADRMILADHFRQRDEAENRLLGIEYAFPAVPLLRLSNGEINSPAVYSWVQQHNPDVVILYGTGLIRSPLLDLCPGRLINLHLGLSPWYRGAGTNFWPFVHGEPECVGATIHLAVAKVDAGPILAQVRPRWAPGDGIHEGGTKALMAAVEAMPDVITAVADEQHTTSEQAQDLSRGRVFRQKDFNADAVRTARHNVESGMIERYLADEQARNQRFPIVHMDQTVSAIASF